MGLALSRAQLIQRAVRLIKEFDVRGGGPLTLAQGALGREPAEGRRRARGQPKPDRADRGAADARPRRRRDRIRPSAPRRRARRRPRDPARLARARRGALARRPHPRHLRRSDRRRARRGGERGADRPRDARLAEGGRRHERRDADRERSARAGAVDRLRRPARRRAARGRARRAGPDRRPRVPRGRHRRRRDRPQPVDRLQGHLGRRRLRLAVPHPVGHEHDPPRRVQPQPDAADDRDADPHRSRRRVPVPLRPLQHRRPGPVPDRSDRRELDRRARS